MSRDMLVAMDPPRHAQYRKPLVDNFKAKVIDGLESQVRAICQDIMADTLAPGGRSSSSTMWPHHCPPE